MTIFSEFGFRRSRLPLTNAQTLNAQTLNAKAFALEQLVSIHCTTFDLRWAMVELAWRSFTGMCALVQGQLSRWRARTLRRGKRRGEAGIAAADTMVAAGGR
jgi:hypothetical protein